MTLMDQFKSLPKPDGDFFSAEKIYCFSEHRIGKSTEGYPVILLNVQKSLDNRSNIYLQYVKVYKNITCRISEGSQTYIQNCAVIIFQSWDYLMQEYFFKISETLISSLSNQPTEREVIDVINKFVELLKAITEVPTKSVQGLWGELFLISISPDPTKMMKSWHSSPENRFDFEAGDNMIEVKSAIGERRIHHFSLEQLNSPTSFQVVIASLLLQRANVGITVQDLRQQIVLQLGENFELIHKLDRVIAKTLGDTILDSSHITFNYTGARESIRYYNAQDIPKISLDTVPPGVFDIKFKVDLDHVSDFSLSFPSSLLNN